MHGKTNQTVMCSFQTGKPFLQTDYAKKHVPDSHGKLEDIQSICDNEQTENYVESEQQREEWMVLADFIQSANSNNFDALSENDWHSCSYPYTPQQLLQMSAWINSTKQHYMRLNIQTSI